MAKTLASSLKKKSLAPAKGRGGRGGGGRGKRTSHRKSSPTVTVTVPKAKSKGRGRGRGSKGRGRSGNSSPGSGGNPDQPDRDQPQNQEQPDQQCPIAVLGPDTVKADASDRRSSRSSSSTLSSDSDSDSDEEAPDALDETDELPLGDEDEDESGVALDETDAMPLGDEDEDESGVALEETDAMPLGDEDEDESGAVLVTGSRRLPCKRKSSRKQNRKNDLDGANANADDDEVLEEYMDEDDIEASVPMSDLPHGPDNLEELFDFHRRYSKILLKEHQDFAFHQSNYQALIARKIEHHDAYAGLATASITCRQVLEEMQRHCIQIDERPVPGPGALCYTCLTSTDHDKHPQQVLQGLVEDHRPKHLHPCLEERVTPECLERLHKIYGDTMFDLDAALSEISDLGIANDDSQEAAKKVKEEFGELLVEKLMKCLLSSRQNFRSVAPCLLHKRNAPPPSNQRLPPTNSRRRNAAKARAAKEERELCITPVGASVCRQGSDGIPCLSIASAGTTCTDFSQMGTQSKLTGLSTISLCIWMAERWMAEEEVALHECTNAFAKKIFAIWLPMYDVHRMQDDDGKQIYLSPHHFGFPMMRPRLYSVLTHKKKCKMANFSKTLRSLFMSPSLDVHSLFVAPKEEVEALRRHLAKKQFKNPKTSFEQLLTGAKRVYLDGYRRHPRVLNYFHHKGAKSVVANLMQNPAKRPIVARFLPTLLRGCQQMFLVYPDRDNKNEREGMPEERSMTAKEALNSMGHVQYEQYAGSQQFPLCPTLETMPSAAKFKMAGNGMHCAVVSAILTTVFCLLELKAEDEESFNRETD